MIKVAPAAISSRLDDTDGKEKIEIVRTGRATTRSSSTSSANTITISAQADISINVLRAGALKLAGNGIEVSSQGRGEDRGLAPTSS